MARTLTDQESKVIAGRNRSHHVRVFIKDEAGAWIDYSNFEGRNWIDEVDYGTHIDDACVEATVTLRRSVYKLSLAPLVEGSKANQSGGSYSPKIYVHREIKIETATLPLDVEPESSDWREVFVGRIDSLDWGSDENSGPIVIIARDKGGELLDRFVETEHRPSGTDTGYGASPPGREAEYVLQDILDDWDQGETYTVYTPNGTDGTPIASGDLSGWKIAPPWFPEKQPVLMLCREVAEKIGYVFRWRWSNVGNKFRFEFFDPNRSKTTPDFTVGPSEYLSVRRCALSLAGIRNVVKVWYQTNRNDPDSRTFVTAESASSITAHGRRWMEVEEASNSPINTGVEAQKMADAILSDLSLPDAELEVELLYRYDIDLVDLGRFLANSDHFDTDQDLAVVEIRHRLTRDGDAKTMLTVRGKPASGYRAWVDKMGMPGVGDTSNESQLPEPPVTVTGAVGSVIIKVSETYFPLNTLAFEYHVSTTPGFTPDTLTTLRVRSSSHTATVGNLSAGTTYYVRVIPISKSGIQGKMSPEVSATTTLVGTGDLEDLSVIGPKIADEAITDPKIISTRSLVAIEAVDPTTRAVDLARSGVIGKTLDNVANSVTRKAVSEIDANGRALVDLAEAHVNTLPKAKVNAAGTWTEAEIPVLGPAKVPEAGSITGQGALATKNAVDLATGEVLNKTLANIADTASRKAVASGVLLPEHFGDNTIRSNWLARVDQSRVTFTPEADPDPARVDWEGLTVWNGSPTAHADYDFTDGSSNHRYGWIDLDVSTTTIQTSDTTPPEPGLNRITLWEMNAAGNEATGVRWAGQEGRVLSGEDLYAGSVRSSKLANSAKLGGTMGYGTSFPASPSTNDVFFRTDRGILYYYDGTRWLSVHEFAYGAVPYSQVPGTLVTASSAALFVTPWPDAPGSGQVYLTRWVSNVFIGATNDGTHNWTLQLKAMDGTVIDSHSTSAMAASSGWNRTVRTINSVRTTSSDRHVLMGAVRNNSPSGINWVNTLHGRLVG